MFRGGSATSGLPAGACPGFEAPRGFDHVRRGTGIAEAQVAMAALGVEIDTRRRRYARLLQHRLGEGGGIIGQVAHVAIEVERAVGRRELREACARQRVEQEGTVLGIDAVVCLKLVHAIEGAECRRLRDRRRAM